MAITGRRYTTGRKILIGLVIFILLAGIAFQIFINSYLPPIVRARLENIIVKGSDSLYRFTADNFDVSFWNRSIRFSDLKITIDSAKYKKFKEEKRLPAMTFTLDLPHGSLTGIKIRDLIFKKRIDINQIHFDRAEVQLARHFDDTRKTDSTAKPLWKLISPGIELIRIGRAQCDNLKMSYRNVDNNDDFRWQFEECKAVFSGILVDSVSALDSSRLLFAKNVELSAREIKMRTPDNLYNLVADQIDYASATRDLKISEFRFTPTLKDAAFIRHFGYQHEIYKLRMPEIHLQNFHLGDWITRNHLITEIIELRSPEINVSMDRNARPNPHSKKGQFPHQLVQKAPFGIDVRRLTCVDGTVIYTEKNNRNQLTGKLVFSSVRGTITNITNNKTALKRSSTCVADVKAGVLNTGSLHSIFRFDMDDKAGAFSVNATISKLDAKQLQPLAKAMTSTDLQSFNMHQLQYSIRGNQNAGTGNLKMRYDNMDVLINQVEPDGSFDKKGLMSFLANRLVIYKENPMGDEAERIAENIAVQRDATKSFFSFIWKTLFTSAGKIVIRPAAQRKIEKRKERRERAASKDAAREKK